MKKLKGLVCAAICAVSIIGGVNAATIAVGNDTTTAGARNRSVPLELRDDDLGDYSKVEFRLTISETTYATMSLSYEGKGLTFSQNGDIYVVENTTGGGLSAQTLGKITYSTTDELASNFKIVLNDVTFTKKDGTTFKPGDAGIKKVDGTIKYEKPKSTDASLNNLTVSQGELTPAFDKNTKEYTVQVKDTISTIRLNATPCQGATVKGDGSKAITIGENSFDIEVTAEDGTTKNVYTIRVLRGEIAEPSTYLKSLEINNIGVTLSPKFDPKNNKYTINIGKDISKLNFKYETEYPLAEVEIEGNEDFQEGENLVNIRVNAEGLEEQIYEITVIKEAEAVPDDPIDTPKVEEKKEKKVNIWLIVVIVIAILAVIGGVTFLLFKKKNNKKSKEENSKLPLKRREGSEKTVEIAKMDAEDSPRHAQREPEEQNDEQDDISDEESITEILKSELYEDDRTQRFDSDEFKDLKKKIYEESDIEETKEFDFKDLN